MNRINNNPYVIMAQQQKQKQQQLSSLKPLKKPPITITTKYRNSRGHQLQHQQQKHSSQLLGDNNNVTEPKSTDLKNRRRSRSTTPMRKESFNYNAYNENAFDKNVRINSNNLTVYGKGIVDNNASQSNNDQSFWLRKTSAEIVSEARTLLAGVGVSVGAGVGVGAGNSNGLRLVSTRRPITPREPRRQLYGKLAPPGRPPSAFSLRYLQSETRGIVPLPTLEPIQQQPSTNSTERIPTIGPRSNSVGALLDCYENNQNTTSYGRLQAKLPALLLPSSSLSSNNVNGSLDDDLHKIVSPHLDLLTASCDSIEMDDSKKSPNESGIKYLNKQHDKQKQFEQRLTRSFEMPLKSTEIVCNNQNADNKAIKCSKLIDNHNYGSKMNIEEDVLTKPNDANNDNKTNNNESFCNNNIVGNGFNLLTSKKILGRSNDLLSQSTTETLLEMLKAHSGIRECNIETVQHINMILVELYNRVNGVKGNWRGAILGGLYGLVECSSPKILVAVARVVLALRVTGSNLTGACKLIFKVARNEINDHLFGDTDVPELLIDGLGRASPLDEPEACIYGYGAIRFLASAGQTTIVNGNLFSSYLRNSSPTNILPTKPSSAPTLMMADTMTTITTTSTSASTTTTKMAIARNSNAKSKSIAQRLSRHGAVQLMVLHLQILNEAGVVQPLSGPPLHSLYQLSAALRALAGIPQQANSRVQSADCYQQSSDGSFTVIKETTEVDNFNLELACPHLVKAAEISIGELEIQANIVRTLSILSEHQDCCRTLSEYSARIGMLMGPCHDMVKRTPEKMLALLSRLGYILGNIMARYGNARSQFYNNDVAMEYLMDTLSFYSKQKLSLNNQMGDTVVDVLIKLVRVIANMSVNPEVGCGLGTRAPLGEILLNLLLTTNQLKITHMSCEREELLLATLGALHNLCFYQNGYDEEICIREPIVNSMCELIPELSIALCTTLKTGPEVAKAEAARVLGNMSRNPKAREAFCSSNGLKAIIECLKSNNYELQAASSGVLVNLLGDWERRAPFSDLKGPVLLKEVLQKSAKQEDWLLANIVCQALWNYLIDSENVTNALGENEAEEISDNLAEYLDEKKIFKDKIPNLIWEQFATVGTDLLERIQIALSNDNSPCCSPTILGSDEEDVRIQKYPDEDLLNDKWKGRFRQWIEED